MMKEQERIVAKIENDFAIAGKRDDGIIHVYFKPHTEITVTVQEIMLVVYNELTGGRKMPFIFQAGEYCTINKEARENANKLEPLSPTKASVVYVNTLAHKLIAEFYYKFNKPVQPYKVVWEFSEGIRWLLEVDKEIDARAQTKP
jgi:hypothetical protein